MRRLSNFDPLELSLPLPCLPLALCPYFLKKPTTFHTRLKIFLGYSRFRVKLRASYHLIHDSNFVRNLGDIITVKAKKNKQTTEMAEKPLKL